MCETGMCVAHSGYKLPSFLKEGWLAMRDGVVVCGWLACGWPSALLVIGASARHGTLPSRFASHLPLAGKELFLVLGTEPFRLALRATFPSQGRSFFLCSAQNPSVSLCEPPSLRREGAFF